MILALATFLFHSAFALHIIIDPGHGGTDTGAVVGSAKEAHIALEIAQRLKNELKKNPDIQVTMTRETDLLLPLPDRVKIAEESKAELFISLHANSAPDRRARGMEIFFQNNLPPDEDSMYLANIENQINSQGPTENTKSEQLSSDAPSLTKQGDLVAIIEDLKRQHRMFDSIRLTKSLAEKMKFEKQTNVSIKQAPFFVVSKTKIPSTLIEVGFLTNSTEAKELQTAERQNEIATKIAAAIFDFKEKFLK